MENTIFQGVNADAFVQLKLLIINNCEPVGTREGKQSRWRLEMSSFLPKLGCISSGETTQYVGESGSINQFSQR